MLRCYVALSLPCWLALFIWDCRQGRDRATSGRQSYSYIKVCIIWLANICFWKSSSTFWQVYAQNTTLLLKVRRRFFFKFCGLRKPKLYEKSLVPSNLNSKLFRLHCVRANKHPIDDLSMVLLLGTRKRQPKTVILNEFLCTAYIWFMTHVPRPLLIILCILHKQWFVLVTFCLVRPFCHFLSTFS